MKIVNDKSTPVGVTTDMRAQSLAYQRALRLAECMDKQRAFECHEDAVTPTGADSVFAVVQNNGPENLVIDRIQVNIASTEVIKVELLAAFTQAGGAALTAVNRCQGSGNLFATKGTFYGGVAVTGQGTATEIHRVKLASAVDKVLDLSKAPIVLLPNQALQLKAGTGTVAAYYSISGWFAMVPRANG